MVGAGVVPGRTGQVEALVIQRVWIWPLVDADTLLGLSVQDFHEAASGLVVCFAHASYGLADTRFRLLIDPQHDQT